MANARTELPLCPSDLPTMDGSVVFGVAGEGGRGELLGYLARTVPVTAEVLALAAPVEPTEIFRFAAPCAGHACGHFDGSNCLLAERLVRLLPPVADGLPACQLRPQCRWWQQEGKAACLRCPQIVSDVFEPSELLRVVADTAARTASPPAEAAARVEGGA
jgi:hypothetical protein